MKKKTAVIAVLMALTLLLTGALAGCGGKTTDPTSPDAAQADPEALNAKIEAFVNEQENKDALQQLNDQYSSLYEISMKAEDGKMVYEFRFVEGLETSAESLKESTASSSNEAFVNFRNALSNYTDYEDAVLVIRYTDHEGNTIYDQVITKDTQINEVEGDDYISVGELLDSSSILSELEAQSTEDTKVTAEAEGADTLVLRYQLQKDYGDLIEELKEKEQEYLDGEEVASNLEGAFKAIDLMLPSIELKIKVIIEDINGVELAQRTLTSADYE